MDDGSVDSGYELEYVQYTSPTDAAAEFLDCRKLLNCTTAILTTRDNWAHAAGIAIPEAVADFVDYLPVGEGAVVITAEGQIDEPSYPQFVLRPDGTTELLRVAKEARDAAADTVALFGGIGDSGVWERGVGDPELDEPGFGAWAVDVARA